MNDVIHHYNHTGEYIENQKFTFQENYEQFMAEEAPATRAYATIKKYESLYRSHLKDEFGPSYIFQISSDRIQKFLHSRSLTYSQEYLKSIYKTLNVLFAYAYKNKRMKKNPMDDVDPHQIPDTKKSITIYRRENASSFRSELQQQMSRPHTTLQLTLGYASVNVLH